MSTSQRQGRRVRSKAMRTDRPCVAYIPTPISPEVVLIHCFALGSVRSRR